MKQYLLFFRDDILRRIGKLPFRIVLHYIYLWCTSIFFISKANYIYAIRKNRFIIRFLDEKYGSLVPLGNLNMLPTTNISSLPIWVFWYQGKSSMPLLIKTCYDSICKNANGRKVILLSKDNFEEYVHLPNHIFEKVQKGFISYTHLSDLIRVSLLYNYGGTWMDATLLTIAPIDNSKMDPVFGTIKIHPRSRGTISGYRWTSFYMFCQPHSLAMKCFRDVMFAFLKKNRTMLDYFFIDYTFELLYQKNQYFKKIVDDNPYTNEHIYECQLNMNYQGQFENEWKETQFFKLNRRMSVDSLKKNSVYGKILDLIYS